MSAVVSASAPRRKRVEFADRWQAALTRALAEGLDVLIEPISGAAFVESASKPGTLYVVSAESCSCLAGQHGIPCKHRACFLAQSGALPLPDPIATNETRATIDCPDCAGRGWWYAEAMGGRVFPDKVACHRCGGSGQMPVRIVHTPLAMAAD